MEHLALDFSFYGNPKYFSCLSDEDCIGRVKRICSHTHPQTLSVRALEHYAVAAASVWVGNLLSTEQ